MRPVFFEVVATDGAARCGRLTTSHGVVETPVFMPVGTRGAVKSLAPDDLRAAGAQLVLANTYHLFLRPGHELILALGGLHQFMGWDGPLLTDSGGFQVWSLAKLRRITEEGVAFRSPIDGTSHFFSPELAIEIQRALGADVIHPLDECLAYPATHEATERSLELTLRWAARSKAVHVTAPAQALFGIVQGGTHEDLRRRAVSATVALGFDGYAIGGMAVGEPKPSMYDLTELVAGLLPAGAPRYLMGVGKPEDLVEAVARGVDMFDCVLPTRNARNGQCFTADGPLTLKQARYAKDASPLDPECACYACRTFSRAYLRHLFMADELVAYRLLSLHNVHFFLWLMREMRAAIVARAFEPFKARFSARYAVSSVDVSRD
ncbi:MAG: tRNA guanosine(34) transglycosylase Tgt [Candidatus Rokubacteria bacterium 13_1_20CM_2_69_58]|nr:MAG: tRNA guanosine(34) transglycosylase Tgt [Candidatus Rokubacteria bacterium 13_1_20CM_4_70_14]OLE46133.1 MAG: tRNA guanosine(34) transglycosylase Tgt [Candidatus Rokubacteria bacterium 13_1_20CM_2_69_58]PYM51673.1 MAG: tRNA guanosine(34) transglycosylase Tgt [Candidatus Rokubacteria bacterium]